MSVATIEIAQPRGTQTSSSERKGDPIVPFSQESAADLARQYITNKTLSKVIYHDRDIYRLGELEIQGQVLMMLGQEHLLYTVSDQDLAHPPLRQLKPIMPGHIDNLFGSYRLAKQYCLDVELRQSKEKVNGKKPENERMRGRMHMLAMILEDLGQSHILRLIDTEIRMKPEFVQWAKERDALSKGETH